MAMTEAIREQCSGFNHRWDFVARPPWARTDPRGWSDHYMVCDTCGSMRRVSIDRRTGEKRIAYYYAEGFKEWKGSRRDFAVSFVFRLDQKRRAS